MKIANATLRARARAKWVWLQPRLDSLFLTAVFGWEMLEDAVLRGDDGLHKFEVTRAGVQARIRGKHYVARLPFVPPAAKKIAMSRSARWPSTASSIDTLALRWLRFALADRLGRATFLGGVEQLLDSLKLDHAVFDEATRSPVMLLKLAYAQLLKLPEHHEYGFLDAAVWLVLIGCAAENLQYPNCTLCFRHAPHGESYCFAHSQATVFPGTRAQKARRYYLGRKAARKLGWDRRKPVVATHTEDEIPNLIARHLWGPLPRGEVSLFKRIRKQLADSPTVRQLLDGPIPRGNVALEALLRDKLDPLEMLPQAWPEKIALAERWLSCELHQAPGVRGPSRSLDAKIQQAERLASRGMSIGQIAKALGCSTATIRSWRGRGRAQRLSQILSTQNRPRGVRSEHTHASEVKQRILLNARSTRISIYKNG
ncbi:helix-turn-helix domain-containing protein [Burkholderia gladioli]|uniref:helix-turn-helix domain-containing protein n=1 Tax=Burkholderia gladioli TaxID=28095 RepID=UPI001C2805D7|nr:helix-turn-helix domain-containing protein [Burkholderia gladioli]MBU9321090.1 helix-turn-helix domain-containing protein [Burkholderia gladioli]